MRSSLALVLLLAVALSVVFVVPAYADKPVVTVWHLADETVPAGVLCVDPVTIAYDGDIRETRWLDDAGLVVKGMWECRGLRGVWISNGNTLPVNSISAKHYTVVYDTTDLTSYWSYTITGPDAFTLLPGHGPILGYAGQYSYMTHCPDYSECDDDEHVVEGSWSSAGFFAFDIDAFCTALGSSVP